MKILKTYSTKASDITREWHTIDAADEILGKVATRAAYLLLGKHKAIYAPNMDVGDFVVIINTAKIRTTGKKGEQKTYYRHSMYPGGLRSITLDKANIEKPEMAIEHAIKGMLPKNKLNAKMMKRLRVFTGSEAPGTPKAKAVKADKAEKPAEKEAK